MPEQVDPSMTNFSPNMRSQRPPLLPTPSHPPRFNRNMSMNSDSSRGMNGPDDIESVDMEMSDDDTCMDNRSVGSSGGGEFGNKKLFKLSSNPFFQIIETSRCKTRCSRCHIKSTWIGHLLLWSTKWTWTSKENRGCTTTLEAISRCTTTAAWIRCRKRRRVYSACRRVLWTIIKGSRDRLAASGEIAAGAVPMDRRTTISEVEADPGPEGAAHSEGILKVRDNGELQRRPSELDVLDFRSFITRPY